MLKPLLGEQCHSYAYAYFFNFLAFPPQLLPQKSIFSRVLRPRVLLRVWIMKQALSSSRSASWRRSSSAHYANDFESALPKSKTTLRVSIKVEINKLNAEASHTTWIRNEKKHFLALFHFNWHLEFSWILDSKVCLPNASRTDKHWFA